MEGINISSLLIDSLYIQPDRISRGAADFALTTYIQSLKITEPQKNEMLEILSEKFTVTGYKGIDAVLNRVQDSLEYAVVNPEKWKELGEGEL